MQVYVIQNEVNGKLYVGQHSGGNLDKYLTIQRKAALGNRGNKLFLYRAMRKHGPDNFNIRTLHWSLDKQDMDNAEIAYIKFFGTQNPELGYNITAGGGGRLGTKNPHSQAFKDAMSVRLKGQPKTKEWAEAIGASQRGRTFTEEHKRALRDGQIGKSKRPRSAEHSLKISQNKKAWWAAKKGESQCQ